MHTIQQPKVVQDPVSDLREKLTRMERDVKRMKNRDKEETLPPQNWPVPPKVNAFHR